MSKEIFMIIIKEQKLEEKLEPATEQQFDLLQRQIDSDPETNRMLTPLIKYVPQYWWLVPDSYIDYHSLLDVLKFLVFVEKRGKLFFSKVGNKFTGFLVYIDDGREITGIKMASFFDDEKKSNIVLALDLINFIDKNISQREKIEWEVDVQNTRAINQYERLLNKRKFIWSKINNKTARRWIYMVTGKQA
jgi:hypothetical protein